MDCQNCDAGCECGEYCTCYDTEGCIECGCNDVFDTALAEAEGIPLIPFDNPALLEAEYSDPAPTPPGLAPASVALATRLRQGPHAHNWQLNRQLMRYKCQICGALSLNNFN